MAQVELKSHVLALVPVAHRQVQAYKFGNFEGEFP
jgi:hypothetical protein